MTRQTDLPNDLMNPVTGEPGFSFGFTQHKPGEAPRPVDPALPPRLVSVIKPQHKFTSSSFFTDSTSRSILGANINRRWLMIQNIGTADVYIAFGGIADTGGQDSLYLPPTATISFEFGICPNNDIFAVSNTQGRLTIIEGSEV